MSLPSYTISNSIGYAGQLFPRGDVLDNNGEDDVPIVSDLDGVVEDYFPPFFPQPGVDIYPDYFFQCRGSTGDYFGDDVTLTCPDNWRRSVLSWHTGEWRGAF